MNGQKSYRHLYDTQNVASRDYAMGLQDEQISYFADLQQIGASAENQVRSIYDRYLQEVRAASVGDDALLRASAAYRKLSARVRAGSGGVLQGVPRSLRADGRYLGTLTADASTKMMDSWIEYLANLRQAVVTPTTSA